MEFRPHKYQDYAREFIIGHPVCALILDMGLGKTVITLTALWELALDYFEVGKVLVIAHSNNYTIGRSGRKIEKIAIHHMAGILTAKQCGGIFQNGSRKASSNYGIGKDAEVGLYVDEANTSYCNSNWDSL